jgi:hypothetical protein
MINFLNRMVLIVTIIVAIEAVAEFYVLQRYPTILVVVPIIIITVVAIGVNIWYWLPKYGLKEN